MRLRPLLIAALLALAPLPAHADPLDDTVIALQGSVAYACYGCGTTATFQGVATVADPSGVATYPVTGSFDASGDCGPLGWLYGTIRFADTDYTTSLNQVGAGLDGFMYGPRGAFEPWFGEGSFALDAPPGTCGLPLTASVTVVWEPGFNCACLIAGRGDG